MRMLWISFLLIGSITCAPQTLGSQDEQLSQWYRPKYTQQGQYQPVFHYPSGQASGSEASPGFYPISAGSGFPSGAQQSSNQGSQHGVPADSSSHQVGEESYSSSSDPVEDEPEFTPVNDQDVVYAKKSRSRYSRKQFRVATFHYDPTQSVAVHPPAFPFPGGKVGHPGQDPMKHS